MAGLGCESLQKKFVRKSKPHTPAAPIINFQDYSHAMTPLDRYRKHYAMFDYWNAELLDALDPQQLNPKRVRQASAESLQELQTLQRLLRADKGAHTDRLVAERVQLDQQLQAGLSMSSQVDGLRRAIETQTRAIHRELFWREVQDSLNEDAASHTSSD